MAVAEQEARLARASSASSSPTGRAWQRMLSGRRLDLLDPSPMDIEIEDIAHGLARVARWNGQTRGEHAFSVAQHCLVVETLVGTLQPTVTAQERLGALLHDAAEYVIGDMISPFKAALGVDYRTFETRLEGVIRVRFGLTAKPPAALKKLIKRADQAAAFYEATRLAGFELEEAISIFGAPPPGPVPDVTPLSPSDAQTLFLTRFSTLMFEADSPSGRN